MSRDLLPSLPGTVLSGWLPGAVDRPVLSVGTGDTVAVDTVCHQGLMRRHGPDPVGYFGALGVAPKDVPEDVRRLAESGLAHDPAVDGPHVVTGPIEVRGARPGDVLAVRIEDLVPRAGYGVVAWRGGRAYEDLCALDPVTGAGVTRDGVRLELRPSLGVMGVATSDGLRRHSTRVGTAGGYLDLPELTVGGTLHLPVQVPGALFHVGGPRYGTRAGVPGLVWDGPLRAVLRLDVIPNAEVRDWSGAGRRPFVTTADHLTPLGLDADVDRALTQCQSQALELLTGRYGVPRATASARLDAADFRIHRSGHAVHARLPLPRREPVRASAA